MYFSNVNAFRLILDLLSWAKSFSKLIRDNKKTQQSKFLKTHIVVVFLTYQHPYSSIPVEPEKNHIEEWFLRSKIAVSSSMACAPRSVRRNGYMREKTIIQNEYTHDDIYNYDISCLFLFLHLISYPHDFKKSLFFF